jgi:hypothetical protein
MQSSIFVHLTDQDYKGFSIKSRGSQFSIRLAVADGFCDVFGGDFSGAG